jgi:DNA-binding NarL/FixJ family response regulator
VRTVRLITKRKDALRKVKVLIAVEPLPLLRVIEHLFGGAPEIQIISRLHEAVHLVRQVRRLQPDLIIVNARLLGPGACQVFNQVKRASPHSKLILTDFSVGSPPPFRQWGVDVYLEEETLVKQLLSQSRLLTAQRAVKRESESGPRARRRTRRH